MFTCSLSFSLLRQSYIKCLLVTILYVTNSSFKNIWFISTKCNSYNCIGRIRGIKYVPSFPQPLAEECHNVAVAAAGESRSRRTRFPGNSRRNSSEADTVVLGFRISRSATAFISGLEIAAIRANVTMSDWL